MTLIMGRWEAWGGSRAGPRLERKSDPSSFDVRLVVDGAKGVCYFRSVWP